MFGVTTPCVERARAVLERAGYEVLVFHATGSGGQAMESLINEGLIAGVLNLTTTELADEHVGGFLSAGPHRLSAAGAMGIPQVVSTGAADMVNFYAPSSVPGKFQDRLFYQHNANVTLMRTTASEARRLTRTSPGSSRGRLALWRCCCRREGFPRSIARGSRSTTRRRGGRWARRSRWVCRRAAGDRARSAYQ